MDDRVRAAMTHSVDTRGEVRIDEWAAEPASVDAELDMLAEVLHAVVHAGASVSFCTPFSIAEAHAFWVDKILPEVRAGKRRVLVARVQKEQGERVKGKGAAPAAFNDRIVGTVQLELEMPPNQQHRAAVAKLLVHPEGRRRGIARALMIALEGVARAEKRTLLTLDTVSESNAELLYRSLDYIAVGVIPGYARGALTPDLEGTTIMYKEIIGE